MSNTTEYKYECDIFTAKKGNSTTKTTLSLEEHLVPRDNSKDSQGLIHEDFSRFVVNILENVSGGTKTSVKANIPISAVPIIYEKVQNAIRIADEMRMKGELVKSAGAGGGSTAKEPTIMSISEFKGMTPSQVLTANPANKKKLMDHIPILQQNVSKYRGNADLIAAINSAIAKLDNGTLSAENTQPETKQVGILKCYISDMKYFREEKAIDNVKHNRCYQLAIEYNANMDIPFDVKIYNCWCPLTIKEGGQTLIQMSAKKEPVSKNYRMSEEDMMAFAGALKSNLDNFNTLYYGEKKALTDSRIAAKRLKYSQGK